MSVAFFIRDYWSYYVELEIKVEEGETLYFGLYKNQTAQSNRISSGYYDMDWAGADQFQLYYLGTDDPIMFDEDKFNWDYLPQERSLKIKPSSPKTLQFVF